MCTSCFVYVLTELFLCRKQNARFVFVRSIYISDANMFARHAVDCEDCHMLFVVDAY